MGCWKPQKTMLEWQNAPLWKALDELSWILPFPEFSGHFRLRKTGKTPKLGPFLEPLLVTLVLVGIM